MINIRFSPLAFMKMQTLINGYNKEVGWYGTTEKISDHNFRILDIIVPPQYTSAAYISDCKDDPLEFQKWLDTLDDDTYNAKRFHGHSHVNMTVSPSGTDDEFFNAFSHTNANATINSYTIDLIINKKMDMHWWVMDEDGTEYKNKDINWTVEVQPGVTIDEFFESTKGLVRDIYTPGQFLWGGSTGYKTAGTSYVKTKADREAEKNKPKVVNTTPKVTTTNKSNESKKSGSNYSNYYGYELDDDPNYNDCYLGGYSDYYGRYYDDLFEEDEELTRAYMIMLDSQIEIVDITGEKMVDEKDKYYYVYDDLGDIYFFDIEKIENAPVKSIGRHLYCEARSHAEAKDPDVVFYIEGSLNDVYWEILGNKDKLNALKIMLNVETDDVQTDVYTSGKIKNTEVTFRINKDEKEEDK